MEHDETAPADAPPVHGPGTAEQLAAAPTSDTRCGPLDRNRLAVLRHEQQQRAARLNASLRRSPSGGTLHP